MLHDSDHLSIKQIFADTFAKSPPKSFLESLPSGNGFLGINSAIPKLGCTPEVLSGKLQL
jgi:hypothetical protein